MPEDHHLVVRVSNDFVANDPIYVSSNDFNEDLALIDGSIIESNTPSLQ